MTGATLARIAAAAWGLAIVVAIVVARFSPAARATLASEGPACPFLLATGVECPFCGMTRASLALGAGEWRAALAYHPFAPVVLVGVLALLVIITLGRTGSLLERRRPYWLLGSILAIWIARLVID